MERLEVRQANHDRPTPLSFSHWWPFNPLPFLDPECGLPFDIIPDAPGVIGLIQADGSALVIEACKSMRQRVTDYCKGIERVRYASIRYVAYEPASNAAVKHAELDAEHEIRFGRRPTAIPA
jgi:hypothetical protein